MAAGTPIDNDEDDEDDDDEDDDDDDDDDGVSDSDFHPSIHPLLLLTHPSLPISLSPLYLPLSTFSTSIPISLPIGEVDAVYHGGDISYATGYLSV